MKFAWDPAKAKANVAKHEGVSFEEAGEAFDDPDKIEDYQLEDGEDRWRMIARSKRRLLFVVYSQDDDADAVRIISARKAEKHEKARYRKR